VIWTSAERNDFRTHLIYVTRLEALAADLKVRCTVQARITNDQVSGIREKLQLINVTRRSIVDELLIVRADAEYSQASVLWLPTKVYYLIYHQLCVIEYVLTADKSDLRKRHGSCIDD
jgi:hypothetical protein